LKGSLLHSVAGRVTAFTALGAAAIGVTLGLFFAANTKLKSANEDNARAAAISAASFDLRARVLTLDNSFKALIASHRDPTLLARWHAAERSWRPAALELERAAAKNAGEEQRTQLLRAAIDAYISDFAEPVIGIAQFSPSAARSAPANAEGSLRIATILKNTDTLAQFAAAAAANRSADANRLAHRATVAGVIALVIAPLLLIALGIWLGRSVARPLRRTVGAATSVAAGDFDVRLDEHRRDEFGELGRAFNAMTTSLAVSRDELVSRADSLEQAEKHKSELISMVSHEVRTPLASILGFTRLLLERDLSEADRQRYLQIVDAEATRLAGLVSDFLDARLIEEGQFAMRRELFDIRALVLEQAELTLAHDEEHQLALEVRDTPLLVDADRSRLAQVVANVLSNAVKFSPAGGTITVGATQANGSARIWIDDEGTGIDPEHRAQIFEPFYRGGATAAGIPGTGLGLAVSRRIIEAHGGRIGFDALAAGTRFWIEMPVEEPPSSLVHPDEAATS
jgi:signal transduction histidine kinase